MLGRFSGSPFSLVQFKLIVAESEVTIGVFKFCNWTSLVLITFLFLLVTISTWLPLVCELIAACDWASFWLTTLVLTDSAAVGAGVLSVLACATVPPTIKVVPSNTDATPTLSFLNPNRCRCGSILRTYSCALFFDIQYPPIYLYVITCYLYFENILAHIYRTINTKLLFH